MSTYHSIGQQAWIRRSDFRIVIACLNGDPPPGLFQLANNSEIQLLIKLGRFEPAVREWYVDRWWKFLNLKTTTWVSIDAAWSGVPFPNCSQLDQTPPDVPFAHRLQLYSGRFEPAVREWYVDRWWKFLNLKTTTWVSIDAAWSGVPFPNCSQLDQTPPDVPFAHRLQLYSGRFEPAVREWYVDRWWKFLNRVSIDAAWSGVPFPNCSQLDQTPPDVPFAHRLQLYSGRFEPAVREWYVDRWSEIP